MFQIYHSRDEVAVLKWDGTEETLNYIKANICTLCEGLNAYIGFTFSGITYKDTLVISMYTSNIFAGTLYNIGDYIVIDMYYINNGFSIYEKNPIKKYDEEQLNRYYISC